MIGKKVWRFDENRRRYRPGSNGPPIWREHWVEVEVLGETSRSWLVGLPGTPLTNTWAIDKLPKKAVRNGSLYGWSFSLEEIERGAWVTENRHKISDAVRRVGYDQLRQVAAVVGYSEKGDE